ncbi:DUF2599 domain-containing protein [Nocardia miyunensis]|uniref:DUF2599 domain-containing protein n=1 Tax=Nocardia miyunensis TaxID=282684 RepID=UPI00082AA1A2|nr:DUF2599 domain-containing protein [Nocardia miyunensis]
MRYGIALAPVLTVVLLTCGCGAADESSPVAIGTVPSSALHAPATARATTPAKTTSASTAASASTVTQAVVPSTDPYPNTPLIDHTQWTDDSDGRRLHVYPTPAGRDDWFPAALDRAWGEVLKDAPEANTPGMYDQFECHWQWARLVSPNKPSWNLEPWRPAVGYDATVQALCNPGGPDPAGK